MRNAVVAVIAVIVTLVWLAPSKAATSCGIDATLKMSEARDATMRFIRVMVLPRALHGERSIRYVDEADRDKPKRQTYKIFCDEFIEF